MQPAVQLETEVDLGRSGRKRKDGPRHPSGALVRDKPARQVDDKICCGRQPHRRMLSKELQTDARAESPLGRLLLKGLLNRIGEAERGTISEAARDRYEAGIKFAQIVGAYRSTIAAPRSTAGSGRGSSCMAATSAGDLLCQAYPEDCACLRVRKRYDGVFVVLAQAGRLQLLAVNRVAVHGEAIGPEQLVNLVDGLDVLVRYLGLTPRRTLRATAETTS